MQYIRNRNPWAIAIAVLGLATAAHGQAVEVEVHPARIETYDVRGRGIEEVKAAFGPDYVARTRWRVDWKYGFQESGGCRLTTFRVEVTATIRMPRWADRDQATPQARATWDAFEAAMLKHEEGHRDNGIQAGRELARQMREFETRPDCRRLQDDVAAIGARVIATFNAADIEYDRVTRHGYEQGGVLR
jgi:predicted secreted Zn-dependent protease